MTVLPWSSGNTGGLLQSQAELHDEVIFYPVRDSSQEAQLVAATIAFSPTSHEDIRLLRDDGSAIVALRGLHVLVHPGHLELVVLHFLRSRQQVASSGSARRR